MEEIMFVNADTQTVSARELHRALEIKKRFSEWFETNSQNFLEGQDFNGVYLKVQSNQYGGEKEIQDYDISVDMAKHICLMSRTEKGKECRQYLIDLEKAWNTPEQVMARALKIAEQTLEKVRNTNRELAEKIEQDKPKTVFADAVSTSNTTILIGELAKILKQNGVETGEKRLFARLRKDGYLISRKGTDYNMPTQRSMELGLIKIKETAVTHADGHTTVNKTPKITGKGQAYFINKFLKELNEKKGEMEDV